MSWKQHVYLALILGLCLRLSSAYFAYGSQSNDDYAHGLLPALELANGGQFSVPVWRSPLLVWTLSPVIQVGKYLGIETSFSLIRFTLMSLGVFSVLGLLAYARWGERLGGALGLYLLSAHFIMSFGSTRAFGESIAMTFVLIGFLMIGSAQDEEKLKRPWLFLIGGLCLGLACLYRFQIGVLGVGFFFLFLAKRQWHQLVLLSFAGIGAALLQAWVDLSFGRLPLETLYNYVYVNKDGAVEHSVQPWFNTWLTLLPLWLLPLSLPFLTKIRKFNSEDKTWLLLIALFVLLHSLIPHKEERFLFPIVPLMLILFAKLWNENWGTSFEKWFFRPVAATLLGAGLVISSFSNSQAGEYEPLLQAQKLREPVLIWDFQSTLSESNFAGAFARPPISLIQSGHWPGADELNAQPSRFSLLVTSKSEIAAELPTRIALLNSSGWNCRNPEKIQSISDCILYSLNPKFNWRRKPTWMVLCERLPGGSPVARLR